MAGVNEEVPTDLTLTSRHSLREVPVLVAFPLPFRDVARSASLVTLE